MANNIKTSILTATLLLLTGCQTSPPHLDHRPALVQKLEKLGVTDNPGAKILLIGNPGRWGSGTQVIIPTYLLAEMWDTIYQSRSHQSWVSSGYRRLRFYKDSKSEKPLAELFVNSTDMCYFEDNFYDSYHCPGINKFLTLLIKREYEKNNPAEK